MTSPVPIHTRMRPLRTLAAELETSDPYTSGHSRRVARYSTLIGGQLMLAPGALGRLRTAAMLHDIGKIGVPPAILHKPAQLTSDEYSLMKSHAARGADMILDRVGDHGLATIVRHHHERYDGEGYPSRLAGSGIPLGSRVIAVADTFDAIASRRPYRRAGSFDEALTTLIDAAGTQLDPEIVSTFCMLYGGVSGAGGLDLLSDLGADLLHSAPGHMQPVRRRMRTAAPAVALRSAA